MAEALALAFDDDPVMRWLFGDEPPRPVQVPRGRSSPTRARRHLKHHSVYTADGHAGRGVLGSARPLEDVARSAWCPLAPDHDRAAIGRRLVQGAPGLGRMEKAHAEHPDHYYLAVLGTRPDHQGEGIGAALMAPVLDQLRRRGPRRLPRELEGVEHPVLPAPRVRGGRRGRRSRSGPTIWPMWRDPQPPADERTR